MKKALLLLVVAVVVASMTGCGWKQIPPANVGIRFDAVTGISDTLVKPQVIYVGIHQKLITYPTSIHNALYCYSDKEGEQKRDDAIRVSTLEGAKIPVDVMVSYHVDPENVVKTFKSFGTSDLDAIQASVIRWTTIWGAGVVAGKSSIFDLISKDRSKFGPEVRRVIGGPLSYYGITVDDVSIRQVYTQDYDAKIQERLASQTQLNTERIKLRQSSIDAKTMLTNARREADENQQKSQQGEQAIELKRLELRNTLIERWDGMSPLIGDSNAPFTGGN